MADCPVHLIRRTAMHVWNATICSGKDRRKISARRTVSGSARSLIRCQPCHPARLARSSAGSSSAAKSQSSSPTTVPSSHSAFAPARSHD